MKKLFVVIAATFCLQILTAQNSIYKLQKYYKVTLTTSDSLVLKGYLVSLTDSSINIIPKPHKGKVSGSSNSRLTSINYNKIDKIIVGKPHATRGLLIGALSGALIGVAAGATSGDDTPRGGGTICILCFTAAEKATLGAVVFGIGGGALGAAIGLGAHKTFNIKGDKQNFDTLRLSLIH